jgi:hypothetical protein
VGLLDSGIAGTLLYYVMPYHRRRIPAPPTGSGIAVAGGRGHYPGAGGCRRSRLRA